LFTSAAGAQPAPSATADQREQAASAYDEGATLFDRAQYGAAALAFLRADDTLPSLDAVSSALVAARKSNDHLLIVRVAERAIARESADAKLAAQGRHALLDAARHLARLDLSCEPEPCTLTLDQVEVKPGSHYVLPGTHAVSAGAPGSAPDDERLRLDAGVTYRVLLHPVRPGSVERPSEIARATPPAPSVAPPNDTGARQSARKPFSPVVVYTGAAVTAVFTALTVWSGIDTLSAKSDLSDRPSQAELDAMDDKMLRSNLLGAAALISGGLTTYAGLALVDWSPPAARSQGTSRSAPRGALLTFAGRF
jgi:hypothetical protein